MRVFSSGNTDEIIERARACHATTIEVAPVGLRDVFLCLISSPGQRLQAAEKNYAVKARSIRAASGLR